MAVDEDTWFDDGLPADLMAEGFVVRDGFVSPARLRALHACAERRRERGDFRAAQIGADARQQRRAEIRGDSTCWLEEPLYAEERALLGDLEGLRLSLNRRAFLGLLDLELHYARFPPGSGYERHVDQLRDRHRRTVSVVLYLNTAWERGAGGSLRLFNCGSDEFFDIEPIGGRLVCFLTAGREHAVLPTRHDRLSISGWFRGRDS